VSSRKPFGFATNFSSFNKNKTDRYDIRLYRFGDDGYVNENQAETNREFINKYKVIVPYASPGGDDYPHQVLSRPIIAIPKTCCTETYLVVGPFKDKDTCENVVSYMKTKFFRFLILLIKNTQHVTRKTYCFIPDQDFTKSWNDKSLYKKYDITDKEIKFIESLVKSLE
jgi:site-specific DNA-methyltransferase (adenine-specific)